MKWILAENRELKTGSYQIEQENILLKTLTRAESWAKCPTLPHHQPHTGSAPTIRLPGDESCQFTEGTRAGGAACSKF